MKVVSALKIIAAGRASKIGLVSLPDKFSRLRATFSSSSTLGLYIEPTEIPNASSFRSFGPLQSSSPAVIIPTGVEATQQRLLAYEAIETL